MIDVSDDMSELVYLYGSVYGPQILLVATLSAITIFRRQISCNHVYAEQDMERRLSVRWNEREAEEMLNRAGLFFSGSPLFSLVLHIAKFFRIVSGFEGVEIDSRSTSPLQRIKQNVSTGDLLELAGNFYCGEPVASLLLRRPLHIPSPRSIKPHLSLTNGISDDADDMLGLPADAWIHVMSFLKPIDVVTFSCASKSCQKWVESGESSNLLWKSLWRRDYEWILQRWTVGKKAASRSLTDKSAPFEPPQFSKFVYFRFGLCYMDYVLAGCNTFDDCLVGIAGHIYDMSLFLLSHPGSPENVMVHAGQDATEFFHRIGHSKGARRLARTMCVAVDQSRIGEGGVGIFPTSFTKLEEPLSDTFTPRPVNMPPPEERAMTCSLKPSTLLAAQTAFDKEQQMYQAKALRRFAHVSSLTQPKVFYDPLRECWRAWYMNQGLEIVFLEDL